jgi:hypothetical protein
MSEQDETAPAPEPPQVEDPPDTSWVEMEIVRKEDGTRETREQK